MENNKLISYAYLLLAVLLVAASLFMIYKMAFRLLPECLPWPPDDSASESMSLPSFSGLIIT